MSTLSTLPIHIPLPERLPNPDGAVFVTLHTVDELEQFWVANRHRFHFAIQGMTLGDEQVFLNEYEWIFAPTKQAAVKAVLRWNQLGIQCAWFDWASTEPSTHAKWFVDRASLRERQIQEGRWSAAEEVAYERDCHVRMPDSFRGWWILTNLPVGFVFEEWFVLSTPKIIDPRLAHDSVASTFQRMTFDDWRSSGVSQLAFHDAPSIDLEIAHARAARDAGADHYGAEFEPYLALAH